MGLYLLILKKYQKLMDQRKLTGSDCQINIIFLIQRIFFKILTYIIETSSLEKLDLAVTFSLNL